jgi:hypothetical protein
MENSPVPPANRASELPDHSCHALLLRRFANRGAPFLVGDSLVQNLPDQATKAMGNHPDRLMVPHARHIAVIRDGEDAPLVLERSVSRLIEKARICRLPFGDR